MNLCIIAHIIFLYLIPALQIFVSPSHTIQSAMVGDTLSIHCVATVSGVDPSSIMYSWVGPGDSGVPISTTSINNTHASSSIQFTYLMEGDDGTYTCNVMILGTNGSVSVVLGPLASELIYFV